MRALIAQPAVASSESVSGTHQRRSTAFQRKTPAAQAQRKLAHLIDTSPRLTAQAQRRAAIFGTPVQKKAPAHHLPHAPEEDETHQLKAVPNRTGLPDNLKVGVEALSGMSLDHVKVHYNSAQPAQLNALAYAQGSDIHVAPGQERHLPHEAWHVVQQAQGRVKPTRQMKGGVSVNDDVRLEREADVMGARATAAQHRIASSKVYYRPSVAPPPSSESTLQRIIETRAPNDLEGELPTRFVSSFDKALLINTDNAVISVAATKDSLEGGHAEIYLEMAIPGLYVEFSIDMFGGNEGRAIVRKKRYAAGGLNNRGAGGIRSYAIHPDMALAAINEVARLAEMADNGTLKYTYYLPKAWNLVSSTTWMNCADFAGAVLRAAGVAGASSGALSMPKSVADST